jgi:hypothetical protein
MKDVCRLVQKTMRRVRVLRVSGGGIKSLHAKAVNGFIATIPFPVEPY